jgi:hypothetical protein
MYLINTHFLLDVLEERIDTPLQEYDNRERLRKLKTSLVTADSERVANWQGIDGYRKPMQ